MSIGDRIDAVVEEFRNILHETRANVGCLKRENARLREALHEMSMCPDVSERIRILGRALEEAHL